jgi:hypothetical protein
VDQHIAAVGVPPARGQDPGEEVRSRRAVDSGDQQPLSRRRRTLPRQVQHVHLLLAVRIAGEAGHLAGAAVAGEAAGRVRLRAVPAGAGARRVSGHDQVTSRVADGLAIPDRRDGHAKAAPAAGHAPPPIHARLRARCQVRPAARGRARGAWPAHHLPCAKPGRHPVRAAPLSRPHGHRPPGPAPGTRPGRTRARRAARGRTPAQPPRRPATAQSGRPAAVTGQRLPSGLDHPARQSVHAPTARTAPPRTPTAPQAEPARRRRDRSWPATPMSY